MGPPNGLNDSDLLGNTDHFSSPYLLAQYTPPSPQEAVDRGQKTAQALEEVSRGCTDSVCIQSQVWAGGIYLAQNDSGNAKKVYTGMSDAAGEKGDARHALLARGLIALQEGRILDAKTLLTPIGDHPYAKELLKLINKNDDWTLSLQTLYLLKALVEDERLKKSDDSNLPRIKAFLDDAEALLKSGEGPELKGVFSKLAAQTGKNYSDISQLLESFAEGNGRQILQAQGMEKPEQRAQTLFALVNEKLLPSHRSGTAWLIGKFFEKNPETQQTAVNLLARLNGFKAKNEGIFNDYIFADMLDNGLTSFLASWVALYPGRMASEWVLGRWVAKYGPEMGWGRRIAGYGLSLTAGTAAYYVSEKSLLGIFGFDGQILPRSGGEFFREFGADMIVMGLANLYGGTKNWLMKDRLESEVPDVFLRSRPTRFAQKINPLRWLRPSQWHWAFYKEASVRNATTKLMEDGYKMRGGWRFLLQASRPLVYGGLLYRVQRWEDSSGIMPRFAPGKTTRFLLHMPESWQNQLLEGYQVQSSEKMLGQLLTHQLTVKDRTVDDQLYNRIATLKQWVVKLSPEATPEQEEMLLGVFWVAQEQGGFGGGAPDILLKWNNEKRYEKLNEYFTKKKIPLLVSPSGEFQFQE